MLCGASICCAQNAVCSSAEEQARKRLAELALQNIEGIWEFPVNGTVIAIERDDMQATRFRISCLQSPYPVIDEGLVLGYCYPTTQSNVFDARLTEIGADGAASSAHNKQQRFTLTVNTDDALEFTPVKKGFSVNWDWWRLFPYMFRIRVNKVDNRQKNLDGALRRWPRSQTVPPRQPRYL